MLIDPYPVDPAMQYFRQAVGDDAYGFGVAGAAAVGIVAVAVGLACHWVTRVRVSPTARPGMGDPGGRMTYAGVMLRVIASTAVSGAAAVTSFLVTCDAWGPRTGLAIACGLQVACSMATAVALFGKWLPALEYRDRAA